MDIHSGSSPLQKFYPWVSCVEIAISFPISVLSINLRKTGTSQGFESFASIDVGIFLPIPYKNSQCVSGERGEGRKCSSKIIFRRVISIISLAVHGTCVLEARQKGFHAILITYTETPRWRRNLKHKMKTPRCDLDECSPLHKHMQIQSSKKAPYTSIAQSPTLQLCMEKHPLIYFESWHYRTHRRYNSNGQASRSTCTQIRWLTGDAYMNLTKQGCRTSAGEVLGNHGIYSKSTGKCNRREWAQKCLPTQQPHLN